MMEDAFNRILSFQIASALECVDDPSPYGALRLLEAAQQMIEFGELYGISKDTRLHEIAERIAEEKGTALTDRSRFHLMVEELSMIMVDIV